MATTARLDLSIWRNDEVYELPMRVIGPDLSGSDFRAQIRLSPDTPGAPLLDLQKVDNGNAEGIRFVSKTYVDGRYENDLRIRINKSTRQALPYAGEMGDSALLAWAFQLNGRTRLVGSVAVLAHTIGSDAAPVSRPLGYSRAMASYPASGTTVTFAEEDIISVVFDGANELGGIAEIATDAAAIAVDARNEAVASVNGSLPSAQVIDLSGGTTNAVEANGATFLRRADKISGLSIAAGATGQGAQLIALADDAIRPAGLAGVRAAVALKLQVSANFDRLTKNEVYAVPPSGVPALLFPIGDVAVTIADGLLTCAGVYNFPADMVGIRSYFQLIGTTAAPATQTVELGSMSLRPFVAVDDVSRADAALDARQRQVVAAVRSNQRVYGRVVMVTAPGQGGDFTTVQSAIDAVKVQAGPGSRALIQIAPKAGGGAYAERSIGGDYIDFVSASPGTRTLIDGSLPSNSSLALITATSTLDFNYDSYFEDIEAWAANQRYVVHWDYPGCNGKLWETKNCKFWHRGNAGARAYQTSIGQDPSAVWGSECAVGSGVYDNAHARHTNSVFWSPDATYLLHDEAVAPYGKLGSLIELNSCEILPGVNVDAAGDVSNTNPVNLRALVLQTYGEGNTGHVILRNNDIFGKVEVGNPGGRARSRWVLDGEGNAHGTGPLTYDVSFAGGVSSVSRIL